jgi:hypothetical protein
MGIRKPKTVTPPPVPDENIGRLRRLIGSKTGKVEVGRRSIDIPTTDLMRELSRTPEGRIALADFYKSADADRRRRLFEVLVNEFRDPTGKSNLNIEGREILGALKGKAASPDDAAVAAAKAGVQAEDAAIGVGSARSQGEYEAETGLDPTELSRYPRPELPQGVNPRAKNLKDPNTDNATASIKDEPGLRTETNVDWVTMEDGTQRPVVSATGRMGDADLARAKKAERAEQAYQEWVAGGKKGPMPQLDPGPLADFKARGSLTSPQEQFDKMFLKSIDGKKASNILQDGIGEVDPLMEMYLMLRANPKAGFSLSPNATFSSPREMAEVLLRNVTPDALANRFNPVGPSQIGELKSKFKTERELAELTGDTFAAGARDVAAAADNSGIPRGTKANLKYYSDQILPALEEQIRRRFGDHWGKSHTEIGVPDDIRTAEPAPKGTGTDLSEGTSRDPSTIPAATDTAPRPESTWQGPLAPGPLTENLAQINAAERGTRMLDRATKDVEDADGVPADWFIGSGRGIEGRTVKPKTDLHNIMKEQIAEINTPIEQGKLAKEDPNGPAEWSPSERLPDPNRTAEIVKGRDASKREFEAGKYNSYARPTIDTRRSARDVLADLQKAQNSGDEVAVAQLKEELRQAIILDSLVSPFGKKGDPAQVGTSEDKPVVSTKGRQGQKAVSEEQIQAELADARIAAGIDPLPPKAQPEKVVADSTSDPESPDYIPPVDGAGEADGFGVDGYPQKIESQAIDPLESAATELDPAEVPKQPSGDAPDNRKPQEPPKAVEKEAEANADAQKAASDAESERPNQEAATIPEETGSPTSTKPKKDGRSWGGFALGTAVKAGIPLGIIGAVRNQMFADRPLPSAWGEENSRPTMEQMPVPEEGIEGTDVGINPFGRHADFAPMSAADRIRLIRQANTIRPNLKTQTAQNWSR